MRLASWLRLHLPLGTARPSAPRCRKRARTNLTLERLEERAVPSASTHDVLYVGDAADNSVKAFDAQTGAFLGDEVAPGAGGLDGPRGMIFRNPGTLLVVGQNPDLPVNGDILSYNAPTGNPLDPVVSSTNPNGTFAPRGIALKDNVLYVADLQGAASANGQIERFDVNNGKFLGAFAPAGFPGQFNPRGVVFGPDGDLYVASFDTSNPLVGYVVRFDPDTGASTIVASNNGDGVTQPGEIADLHRPEGLVFGPDGNLYVTSFRANAGDTDKVLEVKPSTGTLLDEINLDQVGQPRAFAQAIVFGPGGRLFVPITGNGPDTGALRSYDVATKSYTEFIAANADGGPLGQPWYLTFGQTDAATLAYNTKPGADTSQPVPADAATLSAEAVNADVLFAWLATQANQDTVDGHHHGHAG